MNHPAERFTFETPSDPTRFVAEPTSESAARLALGVVPAYGYTFVGTLRGYQQTL